MNKLMSFKFHEAEVDVVDWKGQPVWTAPQVERALQLAKAGAVAQTIRDSDEFEEGLHFVRVLKSTGEPIARRTGNGSNAGFRGDEVTLLLEPGVYLFLMVSRAPLAAEFRRWLATEVLPALRKTGTYSVPGAAPQLDLDERRRLLVEEMIRSGRPADEIDRLILVWSGPEVTARYAEQINRGIYAMSERNGWTRQNHVRPMGPALAAQFTADRWVTSAELIDRARTDEALRRDIEALTWSSSSKGLGKRLVALAEAGVLDARFDRHKHRYSFRRKVRS